MSTYQELEAELYHKGHGARMASRNVATHTKLVRVDPLVAVQFHRTHVLTYYPDNRVVLDNGGWDTATTKARMNSFLGSNTITSMYSRWYVHVKFRTNDGTWKAPEFIGALVPYENGMVINATTGELAQHPSAEPINLDALITDEMRDANRALGREAEELRLKVQKGTLTKSDLAYAALCLDRHKEHTSRLAGYLRQLESGASYTVNRMEDSLEEAVKHHAVTTLEYREKVREVNGQTRLTVY